MYFIGTIDKNETKYMKPVNGFDLELSKNPKDAMIFVRRETASDYLTVLQKAEYNIDDLSIEEYDSKFLLEAFLDFCKKDGINIRILTKKDRDTFEKLFGQL